MALSIMGGKHYCATEIFEVIKKIDQGEDYLEPFFGAGSIFIKLKRFDLKNNIKRKYFLNDINIDLILLYKSLQNHKFSFPTDISKSTFDKYKASKKHSSMRGFVGFITFNSIFFGSYINNEIKRKKSIYSTKKNLLKFQKLLDESVIFSSKSFEEFNPKGMLIYCDPPYKRTIKHHNLGEFLKDFNSDNFWEVMRKWRQDNSLFISEEQSPKDFKCVMEKEINVGTKHRVERLFI
jgi:site-specific DNA-adenine methylase